MRRRRPFSRLFRLLLRLFPAEFRGDFGDDMEADFRDEYRDARAGGRAAEARLWLRTVPGLLGAGLRQHLEVLRRDAGYALRLLARTPGFSVTAIVMIALGTGANAAMFGVVDAVMLRSPFPDSSRLVLVRVQGADGRVTAAVSSAHFRAIAEATGLFEAAGAIGGGQRPILTGLGDPHRVNVECVTAGMFRALATRPARGRTFTADEDRRGGPKAVIVSDQFWRRELGSAPDAVGRVLTLNGVAATIVGVMPRGFGGPYSRNNNDGWLPAGPSLDGSPVPGCFPSTSVNVVARLRPGVTLDGAAAAGTDAAGIARLEDVNHRTGGRLSLVTLDEQTLFELRTPLLALLGAVSLVLLIASANVASLQLDRLYGRRAELSVRMALGASRARIVRQTLVESLVTFAAGGAAGIVLAHWTLAAIVALLPAYMPHVIDIELNGRVFAATLAVTLAAALASGAVPALQGSRPALMSDLRAARGSTQGGDRVRRALAVAQIALSLVLLVGASLMIRTFATLRPASPGFAARDKLTAFVRLQGSAAPPQVFFAALTDRIRAVPGVVSVAGSTYVPMSGNVWTRRVAHGADPITVFSAAVTPNYFDDMAIPVIEGRGFTAADGAGAPLVAIVNQALVRRLFAGASPAGATLEVTAAGGARNTVKIVGVVRDTRCSGSDLKSCAEIYLPFAQVPAPGLNLFVRAVNPRDPRIAAGIRAAVTAIDPAQVVDRVEVMQDMLDSRVATPRFGAWLLGAFAALAVALAAIGLAASIAWWVSQRTKEIGVRMALGADANGVAARVVGQGLGLAAAGIALGLAGAAATTRLLQGWLYGVTPLDPATFAGSAAALLVIAAAASYVPARRASRVDPIVALRVE